MSTAFKERLAAAYAAWGESKGRTPQLFFELMDKDIEIRSVLKGELSANPLGKGYIGKGQVLDYFAAIAESWDLLALETEAVVADGDKAIWCGCVQWRNRKTMRVLDTPKADIWTVRDGKAIGFIEIYDSYGFAKAIGLVDPAQD